MNYLTSPLLLFIAVTITPAGWSYLALGLVLFVIANTFFIRWVLKQIRVEPDLEADDLANAGASSAVGEAAAARSTVGVPRSRSLKPRDPQAEAAATAGSGMPELASAATAAAGPGEMRPGDEISSRPGKLASYEPLIPFSPGAAAENPFPSPARSITPEPAGSLMELVTAAPAAPVVPPPADSISVPSLTGGERAKTPSEPTNPVIPAEPTGKVIPAEPLPVEKAPEPVDVKPEPLPVPPVMPPDTSEMPWSPESSRTDQKPRSGLVELPAVPSNPQPETEGKLVEMPPSPEPPLIAEPDDVKKTKTPKSFDKMSPVSAEPVVPPEAPSAEKASPSMSGLILPSLIPASETENKQGAITPVVEAKTALVPEPPAPPAAIVPEAPITPALSDIPTPSAVLPEPSPAASPVAPIVPEPAAPTAITPVPPESPAPAPEKPAKATGKGSGRGRVFLPSIFGKTADKPVEPAVPEPAAPTAVVLPPVDVPKAQAPAAAQPAETTPPAAEIPAAKQETREPVLMAEADKPVTHPEDARLESLQAIAREPDPETPAPEPVQAKTEPPTVPSVEEDTHHLTAQDAGKEKAPAHETLPVAEPRITPALSIPAETTGKADPNPGLSLVDSAHIHGAAVEPAEPVATLPPEPAAPGEPVTAKAPASEPMELHDLPMLAAEPPALPKEEPVPPAPAPEVSTERVDTAPVLPQTSAPVAEVPAEAVLAPAAPASPDKSLPEVSSTKSQKAAAPAEVASTHTPRSTMPTTDTIPSQAPGARASAQLTLGFEVTSLQLTPFFKLGAVQLRPLSNVVSLHLITTDQAENPLAAGISFQIDTVDLDENSHVKSILLKPLGQAQAATVPQPKLQVDNVQVGHGAEGPIQVTSSQGTSTAVQLLATCTIAAMDFTPSFEIGSLRLEPTSNTVLLRSAPSQRPAALDLPPSFEVANVQLEGSAQIASVRLTPSVLK